MRRWKRRILIVLAGCIPAVPLWADTWLLASSRFVPPGAGLFTPGLLGRLGTPPSGAATAATAESEVAGVVDGFHAALRSLDRDKALAALDPGVRIFESGGAEMSRDEYAAHHLASDMAFVAATRMEVLDRKVTISGDAAWVLTLSKTTGSFRGRDVSSRGAETMVLRKTAGSWHIVHVHWSSASAP